MKRILIRVVTSMWLIFLVALGARLGFAWNQERKIPMEILAPASFAQETGSIAYALATGKGFSSPFRKETGPTAWLTPVYPLLVAGIFKMFGILTRASFFAVVFLNALFSSAVGSAIFYAGKRVGGLGVASAAAWFWAIFPNAVMVPFEWVWDTSLSALLAALLLWATLKLSESARWRDWCAYGLLWGFTLMTNPSLGSLLPFLLGWAAYRARQKAILHSVKPVLAAAAISILCCVPWTVRNYVIFHRLVPLRSNFPLELYIGNNENYATRQFVYPPKVTKERELLRYLRIGEMPFMDEEKRKALQFIRTHPGMEVWLTGQRFVAFWTGLANPWESFWATDSLLVRVLLICNTAAGMGAALGIVVLFWKPSLYAFPLATYPVVFPWLYYITHTNLRYRHPIDPVVLLLGAIAAAGLFKRPLAPDRPVQEADASPPAPTERSRVTTGGLSEKSTRPAVSHAVPKKNVRLERSICLRHRGLFAGRR